MATFPQAADGSRRPAVFVVDPGGTILARGIPPFFIVTDLGRVGADSPGTLTKVDQKKPINPTIRPAFELEQSSGGFDWFETFHVVPRAFDFGQLLSSQSTPIEVFNAHRREPPIRSWTSFTNNAGAGVTLGGLPPLPFPVDPLSSAGTLTVDISTTGDPFVDSTLVFFFFGVGTITVPIVLQRIVLFSLSPELPYTEELAFLTDVKLSKDGTEKRAKLRKSPRQSWDYEYVAEEGPEVQILENLLFDFQSLTFGVPVVFEGSKLTADVAIGATSVSVDDTAFRDYREGGQVAIITSQYIFDVLTIATGGVGATSLTFTSPTINAYAAGGDVYPLDPSTTEQRIAGARWANGLRRMAIRWNVTNNDADLADLSAFPSYKGKLFLDTGNSVTGSTVPNGFQQTITTIDGQTGRPYKSSSWDRDKYLQQLTVRAEGLEAVWHLRRMIWALAGRQTSFYLPSSADDLVVVANLLNASDSMDVQNVGFAQFVRQRTPKADLRVNFVDGSTPLTRGILASSSPAVTFDRLVMDSNWPTTITPAEISRVEYVQKVRLDSDRVKLEYDRSGNRARMVAPIKAVFE